MKILVAYLSVEPVDGDIQEGFVLLPVGDWHLSKAQIAQIVKAFPLEWEENVEELGILDKIAGAKVTASLRSMAFLKFGIEVELVDGSIGSTNLTFPLNTDVTLMPQVARHLLIFFQPGVQEFVNKHKLIDGLKVAKFRIQT